MTISAKCCPECKADFEIIKGSWLLWKYCPKDGARLQ